MDKSIRDKYISVIGLEVHAQLLTKSKIYNTDSTEYGSLPNTNVGVITLAHPGTLPRLNKRVVEYAIKMGLACHSEITRFNIFDRKNYFYPDLPKGYQITQDRTPICKGGYVTINIKEGERNIELHRIHIEEDAGKSMHLAAELDTLVDFNRAGVPLIEIVSQPEIRNSDEAYAYLTEIRKLVRYLDICDGNMEEGSLRCDANISVMLKDAKQFGKKVEVKNMNSIRNVQRAIDHEIERQIDEIEKGNLIVSETRTFDAGTGLTYGMRTKEELNDYRYFPDPDLLPLELTAAYVDELKTHLPELPDEKKVRFTRDYGLSIYDAGVLVSERETADFFEAVAQGRDAKAAANWIINELAGRLNKEGRDIAGSPVSASQLGAILDLIAAGTISGKIAKDLFEICWTEGGDPIAIVETRGLKQVTDLTAIEKVVDDIIAGNHEKAEQAKIKPALIGWFVGQVMKASGGKANPQTVNELLKRKLGV